MSPPPIPNATQYYISNLSLGYAIAIAFGFLILFASILLASYICYRCINQNRIGEGTIIASGRNGGNVDEEWDIRLEQSVINTYPKFPFSKGIVNDIDSVCAICLSEYSEAEMMRMLPDCKHCFHLKCVDAWLELNPTCPVCRNWPMLTPSSTPLADVVPLSQYYSEVRRLRHMADVNESGPSQARAEEA